MTRLTALLDANILYPAPMRDIFLQLAVDDVFRARWTSSIHDEWIHALLRNEPGRDRAALERTRDLMDRATRDAVIAGYEALIPALDLPDPDDRHVLAAAVVGGCDAIVTRNLRDFPDAAVAPYGIEVRHPDGFLSGQLAIAPPIFCESVRKVRARLVAPPLTVREYLDVLRRQGLAATVVGLEEYSNVL